VDFPRGTVINGSLIDSTVSHFTQAVHVRTVVLLKYERCRGGVRMGNYCSFEWSSPQSQICQKRGANRTHCTQGLLCYTSRLFFRNIDLLFESTHWGVITLALFGSEWIRIRGIMRGSNFWHYGAVSVWNRPLIKTHSHFVINQPNSGKPWVTQGHTIMWVSDLLTAERLLALESQLSP